MKRIHVNIMILGIITLEFFFGILMFCAGVVAERGNESGSDFMWLLGIGIFLWALALSGWITLIDN